VDDTGFQMHRYARINAIELLVLVPRRIFEKLAFYKGMMEGPGYW